jgi:hypothetical protein
MRACIVNDLCLSLGWLTVSGAHPLEHIDAAVAGRFNAVGLRLVPPTPEDPLVPVAGNEPLIRDILARLADADLTVLDVETVWIGPDVEIAGLRPALEAAQRLIPACLPARGGARGRRGDPAAA